MGGGGGTAATIQGKSVYYNVIGGEEEQLHQYRVSLFVLISLVEKSSGRERGGRANYGLLVFKDILFHLYNSGQFYKWRKPLALHKSLYHTPQ